MARSEGSRSDYSTRVSSTVWGLPVLPVVVAVAVRIVVFATAFDAVLASRPELTSPTTSIARVYEGIHRGQLGLSPYDGDCTHQAPLVLLLATPLYISRHWRYGWLVRAALCCALDVCIAKCLARSARTAVRVEERGLVWEEHALSQQRRVDMPRVVESSVSSLPWVPDAVAAMYLLHPYTLLTSCALSTSVLCYAALALGLSWACQGRLSSLAWVCVAGYLNPCYLLAIPGFLFLLRRSFRQQGRGWDNSMVLAAAVVVAITAALLLLASHFVAHDWRFLSAVYLWPNRFVDLTPNVGLWWYLFTEVFDRFRPYFLTMFTIHPWIYVAPLTMRFWRRPQALIAMLVGVGLLLSPYPVCGDVGFASCLVAAHIGAVTRMKLKPLFLFTACLASTLLPVMWHLWVVTGAGNANFFYNQTLLYNLCWGVLLLGFVSSTGLRDKGVKITAASLRMRKAQ